jgi:hypothetical protein
MLAKTDPNANVQQIGPRKLKTLAGQAKAAYRASRQAAGQLGEAVRSAVEHDHLHAKAFRSVMAEDRMEPDELADFYAAQEFYREQLGLLERARSAPRLPIDEGAEGGDE